MTYIHTHQRLEELGVFKFTKIKPFDIDTSNPYEDMSKISKVLASRPHIFHLTQNGLHLFVLSSVNIYINKGRDYATREVLVELFGADKKFEEISQDDFYGLRTKVKNTENSYDFFIKSVHCHNLSDYTLDLDRVREYQEYYQTCLNNFILSNGASTPDEPF